jgi:hypothetical protein
LLLAELETQKFLHLKKLKRMQSQLEQINLPKIMASGGWHLGLVKMMLRLAQLEAI